jgi:GTP-binding protein
MYTIAILGRTNVGKTTLFNKLCKQKAGIVSNIPGLTRDRNGRVIKIKGEDVMLYDTPGFESNENTFINSLARQSIKAAEEADLVLFVIDGKVGINDEDYKGIRRIQHLIDKTVLVINKCENENKISDDIHGMPFETRFLISAEHNLGIDKIIRYVFEILNKKKEDLPFEEEKQEELKEDQVENKKDEPQKLRISIIGRPNAGKSTFINSLIKEERVIVSSIPGTTRDSISVPYSYTQRNGDKFDIEFIDTAGIRKKTKITDQIESESVKDSFKKMDLANIVLLMTDVENVLNEQDLNLARLICEEGRIPILLINKWDKVAKDKEGEFIREINDFIVGKISQVKGLSFFTLSAIYDSQFDSIIQEAIRLYKKWNTKLSSRAMNEWLENLEFRPFIGSRKLKLKFIKQISIRPQRFVIFANFSEKDVAEDSYNFIRNNLIKTFSLEGVPVRIEIKKQVNPYKK